MPGPGAKLGLDRFVEYRAESFDGRPAFLRGSLGRIPEVAPGAARLLEALLTIPDGTGKGRRIGWQLCHDGLAYQLRAFGQHDRSLELAGMTGAALELVAQPESPRLGCEVGKCHCQPAVAPNRVRRRFQRGEVAGIEMRVGNGQYSESMPSQADGDIQHRRRDGLGAERERSRETLGKCRR